MFSIGKVRLIHVPEGVKKVDLWSYEENAEEGHLRMRDIFRIFNWDQISYVDDEGCNIQLCAHFSGPLKGFSTDRFNDNQYLVVSGRKDAANRGGGESMKPVVENYGFCLKEHDTFNEILEIKHQIQGYLKAADGLLENISEFRVK